MRTWLATRTLWSLALLLVTGCGSCTKAGSVPSAEDAHAASEADDGPSQRECAAGSLPRLDASQLGTAAQIAIATAASRGLVAIRWTGGLAEVVSGCTLQGRYAVVDGRHDGGKLNMANRLRLELGELPEACAGATHLLGAFATRSGATDAGSTARFAGILVPLPCPPSADPAPGCVAPGSSPTQRKERAEQLHALGTAANDLGVALELAALDPSDPRYRVTPKNEEVDVSFGYAILYEIPSLLFCFKDVLVPRIVYKVDA